LNPQNFCKNSSEISSEIISCFWVKKPWKIWNWFYSELSKNYKKMMLKLNFWTFQKLRKNDVKIEFLKLQKFHSDSKTHSNVQFKVQNAGPYCYVMHVCANGACEMWNIHVNIYTIRNLRLVQSYLRKKLFKGLSPSVTRYLFICFCSNKKEGGDIIKFWRAKHIYTRVDIWPFWNCLPFDL